MLPVKTLPKSLPEMETSFDIDVEGNVTQARYQGTFKFRIPNMRTRALADKERARLDEGLEKLDETVKDFHTMIGYLRHTLVEAPDWWKKSDAGYDLFDANVITSVYVKVMEFEKNWLVQVWGEQSEEGSGEKK